MSFHFGDLLNKDGDKENIVPNMDDSLDSYPSTVTNSTARDPTSPTVADCDDHDEFDGAGGILEDSSSRSGDSPPTPKSGSAPSVKRRRCRGEGRFVCATCGKHLSSKHALALHERTVHLGARDHPCGLCPHQAKQSSNLQRHTWAHHCPDKLMEKYKEGLSEEEAKTVTAARLWREAVEPMWDKLWKQLSAKNQRDLQSQKSHFGLLATTAELLGLEETNGESGVNGVQEFPDMPMTPLPPEELAAVEQAVLSTPCAKSKKVSKKEVNQSSTGSVDGVNDGDASMKIAVTTGKEATIRPCLTCHAQHEVGEFHPIVQLMNVTKDDKNNPTSCGKEVFRCDRCRRQEFTCYQPLMLALHQATVHGFLPAITCPICPRVFAFNTDLAEHLWRSHNAPCPFCAPGTHSLSEGDDDRSDMHETDLSRTWPCPVCNNLFLSTDSLAISLHLLENHTPMRLFKACCSICPAKFLRKEDWSEHLTSAHHDSLPEALKIQK